ncbi:MAG: enoyl-ACP reductase FabV [Pseudomonadales bacterium]
MVIKPRVRGFISVTTHPAGCEANIKRQIDFVKAQGENSDALASVPKRVLVLGASTGYGLASRITAAFGNGASTLGVFFEKEGSEKRPATAGWYNSAAFHKFADQEGLYAKSINGDAFSDELKQQTIDVIKEDFGQVDLVVYSLAAPRRTHPKTGEVHSSTLKPIGQAVVQRGINTDKETVDEFTLEAASQEEIDNTVAVMGGEDWAMWIDALSDAGVLADGAKTSAYTYIGDRVTWDIYWHGTIGQAKKDLDARVLGIREKMQAIGGDARVSVLQAVVTQASAAIPVMPLYQALLFRVMKEAGTHEGCIEQIYRLFTECLYSDAPVMDDEGRLRVDGNELKPEVQLEVERLWDLVNTDNLNELTDLQGYKQEFLRLFGFAIEGVDYEADVSPIVDIKNLL